MIRHCAIFLALTAVASAQTLPPAVLSGQVTDSLTHQPIAGVKMWADPDVRVTTDASGKYSLVIPVEQNSAATILWADKPGYAPSRPGQPVGLKPGAITNDDVELDPAAAISGLLLDRDSDQPLSGFMLRLLPVSQGVVPQTSGSDGRFTFADLPPGAYSLEVIPPAAHESPQDKSGYADAWYPGVDRPDMAATIALSPGATRTIEVRMQKRELHTISGTLKTPEGFSGDITVVPMNLNHQSVSPNRTIHGGSSFRLDGFAEGSYSLHLAAGKNLFGHTTLDIRDHDVEGLVLALQPAATVRAAIVMAEDDAKPPSAQNMFFNLWPLDGWDVTVDGQDRPDRMAAGSIPLGRHWPFLLIPQPGYAVTAVSYGNQDVTEQPIDVESPDSTVTFTITSHPGFLTGKVQDGDSNPVSDCLIVTVSASLADATTPDLFDSLLPRLQFGGVSAPDGSYRTRALAPGKYKVVVITGSNRGRRTDPVFFREALATAETVTVEAGQTATLDLKVPRAETN